MHNGISEIIIAFKNKSLIRKYQSNIELDYDI